MKRILLVLILSPFSLVLSANTCRGILELYRGEIIQENRFTTSRKLRDYQHTFNFRFGDDQAMLERYLREGGAMTWIDMGAGQGVALRQAKAQNPDLNAMGIAFKAPDEAAIEIKGSSIPYISGKFIEEMIDDGDLRHLEGQVDFITDLYGPLSYSNNFMKVFESYVSLLKVDGVMTFNLMLHRNEKLGSKTVINNFGGKDLQPFIYWLRSVQGLDVEIERASAHSLTSGAVFQSFKVTKRQPKIIFKKQIRTTEYLESAPSIRTFQID